MSVRMPAKSRDGRRHLCLERSLLGVRSSIVEKLSVLLNQDEVVLPVLLKIEILQGTRGLPWATVSVSVICSSPHMPLKTAVLSGHLTASSNGWRTFTW